VWYYVLTIEIKHFKEVPASVLNDYVGGHHCIIRCSTGPQLWLHDPKAIFGNLQASRYLVSFQGVVYLLDDKSAESSIEVK